MQKLIEITEHPHIQVSSTILKYEKPDYVYLPIFKESNILVKKDTNVSIGTPILKSANKILTSPISGKITTIKKMCSIDKLSDFIEIANNFEEQKIINPTIKRNINNIKKDVLDKLLNIHFNLNLNHKKIIILNCIDDDPYTFTENFYLFTNYEKYLELLDKLTKIYDYQKIIICVKSSNSENINKLMECLGMYPNITLNIVPNLYLLGKEQILLNYLNINEDISTVIKASKFYDISNLLLRNRQITDKLITISGNAIQNPSIIKVKIGTKIKDVLDTLIEIKDSNVDYLVNSAMNPKNISIDDLVVTEDLNSILIMLSKTTHKEGKCINCGECINICPVNLTPLLLTNKDYCEKAKSVCLKCGLCSYICPAYIDFNKYMEEE